MAAGLWRWVLTDWAGASYGELTNVAERKLGITLNGLPTAGGRVRLNNRHAPTLLDLVCRLKIYRNNILYFHGPVVTAEENAAGEGGTIAFTAAGAQWRLLKRLLGKSVDADGKGVGYSLATAGAQTDLSSMVKNIVDTVHGDTSFTLLERYTNIKTDAAWVTASSNGFVGPWYFKPALEAITEISSLLGGPDVEFRPVEPTTDANGVTIAELKAVGFQGAAQAGVIFEYGVGLRNMSGYRRPRGIDGLLNRAHSLPQGFPDVAVPGQLPISNVQDASASLAAYGAMEAMVTGDLTVDALRQILVDEHVRIRRAPREQIIFTPKKDTGYVYNPVPVLPHEFAVGDIVNARAAVDGVVRFNATMRVYGVSFSLDAEGGEMMEVTVTPS